MQNAKELPKPFSININASVLTKSTNQPQNSDQLPPKKVKTIILIKKEC